ncbi:MAG: helix-turn-helix domain-containing protein [Spirochaetota bacterium]
MEHLILWVYILIFSSGSAGLISLLLLWHRSRSSVVLPLAAVNGAFLVSLGMVTGYFYVHNVLGRTAGLSPLVESFFAIAASLVNMLLFVFVLVVLRRLKPRKAYLPAVTTWMSVAAVLLIGTKMILVNLNVIQQMFIFRFMLTTWYSGIVYSVVTAAVGLFGWSLIDADTTDERKSVRTLMFGFGICALSFIPLSVIEFYLASQGLNVYEPISVDFLLYLGMGVVAITAGLQDITTGNSSQTPFTQLSEAATARYNFTRRELDMIPLIAAGMSNKEIAYELSISPATVRTHIYNIYRKAEVQSRIELLHQLYT